MVPESERAPLRLLTGSDAARTASEILSAGVDMAYQPIVHLGSGSVIAYEALVRPRHPDASNPFLFFQAMESGGLRLEGEREAFRAAFAGPSPYPRVKLFVNASPTTLVDPTFDVLELNEQARRHGFNPSDVVVEVTESEEIDDLATLARRSDQLRRLGMGLAVDDAGAGHASFRVITRLRPAYIKLDRDLVSNVDNDGARYAFVDAMVRFARQIGSRLVAEGIETEAELACLSALGVEAGQGYFIARPAIGEFVSPSAGARRTIALTAQRPRLGGAQIRAGELARPVTEIDASMTVADAYARFLADPSLVMLVITERSRVVAQLTRRLIERCLASPGSWERLSNRPVIDFAEHNPVTISAELDVLEVGAMLSARHSHQVGDDIVVTDTLGHLHGALSPRDVLRTLVDVRRRGEHDRNPLSGMFGPLRLEGELDRRLRNGERLSALLIDLDGFSRLNDLGGFALGDDLIRVLSRCLSGVVSGEQDAIMAHMGGDDFLVAVAPERYEQLVAALIRCFENEVAPFLRLELRAYERQCAPDTVRLSMASIDLHGEPPSGHSSIDWAKDGLAPLMAMAKQHDVHSCVRRSGESVAVTTWRSITRERRTVALGQAEPATVLAVLDLVERRWEIWQREGKGQVPLQVFPGPPDLLSSLRERFLSPLRAEAHRGLEGNVATMPCELSGHEADLLELLDRLALVAREVHADAGGPMTPEAALLNRMAQNRSRTVLREDRLARAVSGMFGRNDVASAIEASS